MTESAKDRVLAALAFRETAFVPYAFGFAPAVRERLGAHYGMANPFVELGMHVFAVEARAAEGFVAAPSSSQETTDEFGVRWLRSPHGALYPAGHPLADQPLSDYQWPNVDAAGRFDHISGVIAQHCDRFIVAAVGSTLFERAHFLRGFEQLLTDMALRPAFAHQLLDGVLAWQHALLERLLQYPVDGVWFGDDYGHQGGPIMSLRMWRTFIKPRLAVLTQKARAAGRPVFLHCDGAVSSLIADLLEIGVNVLNPCQPEVMDLGHLKRQYGRDLCFCGGISAQQILAHGTPDDVEAELRQKIGVLAHGGGYIVATAGSVQPDVAMPNLVRLLDLLRQQDQRPLGPACA